jgi:hypothetical protein
MRAFLPRCFVLATFCLLQLGNTLAQTVKRQPLMLVTWFGPGAIELPTGQDWKPQTFNVYDGGRRPVAQYSKGADLTVSFILFENLSGNPTAQGCRDDVIGPIIQQNAKVVSKRIDGEMKDGGGEALTTTSFLIEAAPGHHQRNLFAFAGNAATCAEIHLSSMLETTAEEDVMKAAVSGFALNLTYKPTAMDYFRIGSLLFKNEPALATPYYKSSLAALPNEGSSLTARRVITDQLVMSLGMTGDMAGSRTVAEEAIAGDPEYPINYYNLACIEAEQGNAKDAKEHLKQAFDRRANVLKGESMPDPTKDNSILKLRSNAEFWAFVETLPKN